MLPIGKRDNRVRNDRGRPPAPGRVRALSAGPAAEQLSVALLGHPFCSRQMAGLCTLPKSVTDGSGVSMSVQQRFWRSIRRQFGGQRRANVHRCHFWRRHYGCRVCFPTPAGRPLASPPLPSDQVDPDLFGWSSSPGSRVPSCEADLSGEVLCTVCARSLSAGCVSPLSFSMP
jgi:hypothetical protein